MDRKARMRRQDPGRRVTLRAGSAGGLVMSEDGSFEELREFFLAAASWPSNSAMRWSCATIRASCSGMRASRRFTVAADSS